MKKLLILIGLCISLLSCNNYSSTTPVEVESTTFYKVERMTGSTTIVYDKDTRVMYVYSYQFGLRPLYNADGSLKLYKE